LTFQTLQGRVHTHVRWTGYLLCRIVKHWSLTPLAKCDGILLAIFKVTVKKLLAYFLQTGCIFQWLSLPTADTVLHNSRILFPNQCAIYHCSLFTICGDACPLSCVNAEL